MKLYRGESLREIDGNHKRNSRILSIKQCLNTSEEFPSKMLGEGNPLRIVQYGLESTVIEHISQVYELPRGLNGTHFISFSESMNVAKDFATNSGALSKDAMETGLNRYKSLSDHEKDSVEYLLIEFDVSGKKAIKGAVGLYLLKYNSGVNEGLLIKSHEYLKSIENSMGDAPGFQQALGYSADEEEWLFLPLDILEGDPLPGTLSAMLKLTAQEVNVNIYGTSDFFNAQ